MALRATAPVFVPSSENVDSKPEERASSTRKNDKRQRRQKGRRKKSPHRDSCHHRGRRTPKKPLKEKQDILFPRLVSNERKQPISKSDWLRVAERGHEREQEEQRKEAIRLANESSDFVRLTPLGQSSNVSTVKADSIESDSREYVPTLLETTLPNDQVPLHKPQHFDMTKLRNRWWKLVREQSIKNHYKESEEECTLSESIESWDLVETIRQSEPEKQSVDPRILDTFCLESSHPLHCAVMENNEKTIQVLLQQNDSWAESLVEPSQLGIHVASSAPMVRAFSPLLLAVYLDKSQLIKTLYNASSATYCTAALLLAAEMGLEACITALLACGAYCCLLLEKNQDGDTAFHCACRAVGGGGSSATLRTLLRRSDKRHLLRVLSCKNKNGQTPLHVACQYGRVHIVEVFLTECNSTLLAKLLRVRNDANQTPLLFAIYANSVDIVMSLLMWRSNDGRTDWLDGALAYAASKGATDIVLLLLEFMDPTNDTLNAALEAAVRSMAETTRYEIMRQLVQAGANPCCVNELHFSSTALGMLCTKGDVTGLMVMLDAWQSHTDSKQMARRQDPKLRRQRESYFERMEVAENGELELAMTNALILSLFLGFLDNDVTSCHLDAAISLFHRGAQLDGADFAVLKSSICSGRLFAPAEVFGDGENWFAALYHHLILTAKASATFGTYDGTPMQYWSQVLCSMPWMQTDGDIKCSWVIAHGGDSVKQIEAIQEDQVVLIAKGGERFVANSSLLSQKSEKLAGAIRFATMNGASHCPVEVRLEVSAHFCMWILQHIYHGSVVSGWHPDPCQCASDLLELAVIAEEFLCPSLVQECEMRLLSADPFQCYCWSCCLATRGTQCTPKGSSSCAECLYRVRGPSKLLTADCILDVLAVSCQLESLSTNTYRGSSVKWWSRSWSTKQVWGSFDGNVCDNAAPFACLKDAAIQTCLRHFTIVSKSQAFLSQVDFVLSCDGFNQLDTDSAERNAQAVLLQTCLHETATSPVVQIKPQSCSNFRARLHCTKSNTKCTDIT